jgi:hypothetical protein
MSLSEHAFLTGVYPIHSGHLFTVSESTPACQEDIDGTVQSDAGQCGTGMILAELDGKIIISYIRRGGAAALSGKLAIKDEVSEDWNSIAHSRDIVLIFLFMQ